MGVGKKQTVGYWYKMLLHFGICRAPVDGLLEMRVGDRVAWSGELSESGTLSISQPNLFGGESAEGGIDGSLDVMMGEADQVPNTYLVQQLGAEQSAYRGKVTAAWKGGRWGAMNPYPKPVAFKVRRASSEWYPSKAAIPLGGTALSGLEALTTIPVLDGVGGGGIFSGGAVYGPYYLDANPGVHGSVFLCMIYLHPNVPGAGPHTVYAELGGAQIWSKAITWLPGEAEKLIRVQLNVPVGHVGVRLGFHGSLTGNFYLHLRGIVDSTAWRSVVPDQGIVEADDPAFGIVTDGAGSFRYADAVWSLVHIWGVHDSYVSGAFFGMNPAHIIYDSIADPDMLGDPPGAINEASFSAAADVLYAEGFGLCTTYDATAESIDEFQKRICAVIGATCARDRRSGQWMLDLQRGGGDPELLPVLGDDDILDYATEPGTLDDAVNQVVVKWFDPVQKEERSTAPVQALGLIQALGGPVSETAQYPEIPVESLALRAGARDLRNKATPLRRFELKTNRVPFGWRAGTYFRLQTPKRGIADMVCLLGEIDPGTLRQGAISIVAVQDVFSMPAAVYVTPQPAPPAGADEVTAAEHQRAIEVPYAELARALTADELGALSTDAGHLAVLAGQPAAAWNYELLTAATGEDLASRGIADWTPTCLAAAAAGFMDTSIAIVDATGLDELELPVAAAWDEEIVRVDAIDLVAGTIAIGRGCADTVPATHVAGSVLYFVGAAAGADGREYVDGETVSAKVLSRGLGGTLDADATPTLTCVMDSRAARPYPPAGLQISGVAYPASVAGAITVTWAHRDRVQQADALLDTTDASVGPEAGTTYDCSAYDDDTNVLLAQSLGLTGTSWSVAVSGGRDLRIEVVSKRAGLESWQRQVRRFAHVDGLVLLENGDVLTMEQGQRGVQESAPPDTSGFAHRATVALTGTHSASERLVFNLLFSGSTSIINASAAGTTSLAEFASVIAAEFTLRGFFATAAGDSVHVHSTAAFLSLTAYSAWVRNPVAYTVQDAAAPSVGGWQWTFIDLYQSIAFVSTCPDNSAPLATSGLAQVAFDVHKRLRGAAPITGGHVFDGGGDSRRFYLSWYTSPWSTNYLTQLQGLVDAINANADLAANGIMAGLSLMTPPPTPDHAMTRAAAVLTATGNYAVSVAFITPWNASPLPSAVHPSGYFLGIAQWADMGPAIPGGLPQISAFGPRPSAGYALAAGQQWWLSIDGAEYHYVLTGSETSGADVAAGLAALVDPGGDWTVTWESDEALVTATAVDAPFACSVWASYGVRVATNIDY